MATKSWIGFRQQTNEKRWSNWHCGQLLWSHSFHFSVVYTFLFVFRHDLCERFITKTEIELYK